MTARVIPFDSVAVIGCGDAWSDAFAEAITHLIAPLRGVRVVPSRRVRTHPSSILGAEEIGRDVHARCVGVCHVRAEKDALDLRIEVIDVLTERVAAQESFLTHATEILALQERAARWLATFLCGAGARLARRRSGATPAGYAAVLRARGLPAREAVELLRRSDDGSPLLSRELARVVAAAPCGTLDAPLVDAARQAIAHALGARPSARTHLVAGAVRARFDRHWPGALREYDSAIRLDPASPDAYAGRGLLLAALGDVDRAEESLRMASDLAAPFDPARLALGQGLALAGRAAEAAAHFARVAEETEGVVIPAAGDDPYDKAKALAASALPRLAIAALKEAVAAWSPQVMFTAVEPAFGLLHGRPRFADILMNLRLQIR